MRKSKVFLFFYLLTLIVFVTLSARLAVRLEEQRRGSEFYEQPEELKEASLAVLPEGEKNGEENKQQTALPELSQRLSRFAEKYPDTVLWLSLPDTALDYPVMLGKDNQFYLDHLPDGSKNVLGSLFLDYRTEKNSVHLIVYGHNGSGGRMFGLLKQYEKKDYFLEHKTLTMATKDAVYLCPIFSVRRTKADSDAYNLKLEEGDDLEAYIKQAGEASAYQIDVDFETASGVLTLSTCTGLKNQRLLVQAAIVEDFPK